MRKGMMLFAALLLAGCAGQSAGQSRDDTYASSIAWTARFDDAWNATTALAGAKAAGYDASADEDRVTGWRGMEGLSIEDGGTTIVASFLYSEQERTPGLWTRWHVTFEEDLGALEAATGWTRAGDPTWELLGEASP